MPTYTCLCCGHTEAFETAQDAFEASWDVAPYFTLQPLCNLCLSAPVLILGVDGARRLHAEAARKVEETRTPDTDARGHGRRVRSGQQLSTIRRENCTALKTQFWTRAAGKVGTLGGPILFMIRDAFCQRPIRYRQVGRERPAGGPGAAFAIRRRGRSRPISHSTTRAGARDGRHKTPPDAGDTGSAISRQSSSCRCLRASPCTQERRRLTAARGAEGANRALAQCPPPRPPSSCLRMMVGQLPVTASVGRRGGLARTPEGSFRCGSAPSRRRRL